MDPAINQRENLFRQSVSKFIGDDKFEDLNQFLLECIEKKAKYKLDTQNNYNDEIRDGIDSVLLDVNQKIKEYRITNSEKELDKLARVIVLLLDLYLWYKKDMLIDTFRELKTNLTELKSQPELHSKVNSALVDYILEALKRVHPMNSNLFDSLINTIDTMSSQNGEFEDLFIDDKSPWFDNLFIFKYSSLLASDDIKIYSIINQSYYKSFIDPKMHPTSPFGIGRNYVYIHSLIFEKSLNQQIKQYIYDTLTDYYNQSVASLIIKSKSPSTTLLLDCYGTTNVYLPLKTDINNFYGLTNLGKSGKIFDDIQNYDIGRSNSGFENSEIYDWVGSENYSDLENSSYSEISSLDICLTLEDPKDLENSEVYNQALKIKDSNSKIDNKLRNYSSPKYSASQVINALFSKDSKAFCHAIRLEDNEQLKSVSKKIFEQVLENNLKSNSIHEYIYGLYIFEHRETKIDKNNERKEIIKKKIISHATDIFTRYYQYDLVGYELLFILLQRYDINLSEMLKTIPEKGATLLNRSLVELYGHLESHIGERIRKVQIMTMDFTSKQLFEFPLQVFVEHWDYLDKSLVKTNAEIFLKILRSDGCEYSLEAYIVRAWSIFIINENNWKISIKLLDQSLDIQSYYFERIQMIKAFIYKRIKNKNCMNMLELLAILKKSKCQKNDISHIYLRMALDADNDDLSHKFLMNYFTEVGDSKKLKEEIFLMTKEEEKENISKLILLANFCMKEKLFSEAKAQYEKILMEIPLQDRYTSHWNIPYCLCLIEEMNKLKNPTNNSAPTSEPKSNSLPPDIQILHNTIESKLNHLIDNGPQDINELAWYLLNCKLNKGVETAEMEEKLSKYSNPPEDSLQNIWILSFFKESIQNIKNLPIEDLYKLKVNLIFDVYQDYLKDFSDDIFEIFFDNFKELLFESDYLRSFGLVSAISEKHNKISRVTEMEISKLSKDLQTAFIIYRCSRENLLDIWVCSSEIGIQYRSSKINYSDIGNIFNDYPYKPIIIKQIRKENEHKWDNYPLDDKNFKNNLKKWYKLLIEPIQDILDKLTTTNITIIPDRITSKYPFSLLTKADVENEDLLSQSLDKSNETTPPTNHLIDKYNISIAPSLLYLKTLYEKNRMDTDTPNQFEPVIILGEGIDETLQEFADTLFTKFNDITGGLQIKSTVVKDCTNITMSPDSENSSKKHEISFEVLISGRNFIHLVAHCYSKQNSNGYCTSSFSLKSPKFSNQDYKIHSQDILKLNLSNCKFVFLGSCNTSFGGIYNENGYIGPFWAFLSTGCQAVIGSYWEVDNTQNFATFLDLFYNDLIETSKKGQCNIGKSLSYSYKNCNWEVSKEKGIGGLFFTGLPNSLNFKQ